jgi:hypothetical protein
VEDDAISKASEDAEEREEIGIYEDKSVDTLFDRLTEAMREMPKRLGTKVRDAANIGKITRAISEIEGTIIKYQEDDDVVVDPKTIITEDIEEVFNNNLELLCETKDYEDIYGVRVALLIELYGTFPNEFPHHLLLAEMRRADLLIKQEDELNTDGGLELLSSVGKIVGHVEGDELSLSAQQVEAQVELSGILHEFEGGDAKSEVVQYCQKYQAVIPALRELIDEPRETAAAAADADEFDVANPLHEERKLSNRPSTAPSMSTSRSQVVPVVRTPIQQNGAKPIVRA